MATIINQPEGSGNVLFEKPLNVGGRPVASFEPEYQTCNFTEDSEGKDLEFACALGTSRTRTKPRPPDCQPFPSLCFQLLLARVGQVSFGILLPNPHPRSQSQHKYSLDLECS